jgi:hypothetical protein
MHYGDLDLCRYHGGPFDAKNWSVPLCAVGWLEHPYAYNTGTSSEGLLSKLRSLVSAARAAYPHYYFRGMHDCSLCLESGLVSPGPIWSQENIFVPGVGCVYVAPGGVVHYVESHQYLPPQEFVEAVLRCPTYGSPEFRESLRNANCNQPIPLRTAEEELAGSQQFPPA